MSISYVLDTNVLSQATAPQPDTALLALLVERDALVATGAPVIHELSYGAARLPRCARRQVLEEYLTSLLRTLPILPYDLDAARWHARERVRLSAIGRTPPYIDGQIAAIAAVNGCTLVTHNVADFADFEGLRVEDWFSG